MVANQLRQNLRAADGDNVKEADAWDQWIKKLFQILIDQLPTEYTKCSYPAA